MLGIVRRGVLSLLHFESPITSSGQCEKKGRTPVTVLETTFSGAAT